MMADKQCQAVSAWLRRSETGIPPPGMVEHVAACHVCRGVLASILADRFALAAGDELLTCDACEHEIAAFVDAEQSHGLATAAKQHPHVFWHLWVCRDCAEVYEITAALVNAVGAGVLAPIPLTNTAMRRSGVMVIQLTREFLHRAFSPQLTFGAAWSSSDKSWVLTEHEDDGYHIALHVRPVNQVDVSIGVSVTPPLIGWAMLSLGSIVFRAALDPYGNAELGHVPLALLADHTGADLTITIDADEPHD